MLLALLLLAFSAAIYAIGYLCIGLYVLGVLIYTSFGGHYVGRNGQIMHMAPDVRNHVALPIIRMVFAALAFVALMVIIF